ncbi:DNA-3-methyladenine glycosylase 2 family protein [Streptomyces sp. NPDC058371]|uniref:DNA-3-methyladenine glycosylase 2 family protein n=1 Tax=Streptomyces sp. NPDC058371 TaxID=3346463 RepID=UPI0036524037
MVRGWPRLGCVIDEETRYEAVRSRDARFDGEFFFAVETTGIYCRPSCPAVTPKRQNVRYYLTAAAAQGSGFRACRRCRPDAVPGSAEWNVRADVVGRAMRMIGDGVVDREGVAGLAVRLGYSARQVQRQLTAELGAGPVALARAQRAHTARVLLQTTGLPVTEIAFAAGFASVRQFNDTIRAVYASTPSELRAAAPRRGSGGRRAATPSAGIPLRLAHRGPYQAAAVFDLLAGEAVAGVEEVSGTRGRRTYRRTLRLPYGTGIVAVDERPGGLRRPATGEGPGGPRGPATGTAAGPSGGGSHGVAVDERPGGPRRPVTGTPAGLTTGGPDGVAVDERPGGPRRSATGAAAGPTGGGSGGAPLDTDASGVTADSPLLVTAASVPFDAEASGVAPESGPLDGGAPQVPARPGGWLDARLHLTDLRDLTTAVQRLRLLFDLDADPYAVDERLGADPRLAPLVAARPGLRSPGTADPDELAVRALVGRSESERLVQRYGKALDAPCGTLTHLFPEAAVLAQAEPEGTLGALTAALADGVLRLDAGADRDDAQEALLALPGMDARTVAVIRARALGDPDAAPAGDDVPDTWRPWRSYALRHLAAASEPERETH